MKVFLILVSLFCISLNTKATEKDYILDIENENIMQQFVIVEQLALMYYSNVKETLKGKPPYIFKPPVNTYFIFNIVELNTCKIDYTTMSYDLIDKNICEYDILTESMTNIDYILKTNENKEWIKDTWIYYRNNSRYEFQTIMFKSDDLLFMFGVFDKKYNKRVIKT